MRLLLLFFSFSICFLSLKGQSISPLLDEYPLKSPEIREQILRNYQEIISRGLMELQEIDPYVDSYNYTSLSTLVAYAYSAKGIVDSVRYWVEWMDDPAFDEIQYPARMIGLHIKTGIHQRTKLEIEGLKELIEAQKIAEAYNDDFNQSLTMAYRGVALLARGLARDGFGLQEVAIENFEKLGYLKHARNAQANLAAFYIRAGLYQKSLDILLQLIDPSAEEMTEEFRSFSALNAALAYIRLGRMEEADSLITVGASVAANARFQPGTLYALTLRMNYLIELGKWEKIATILDEIKRKDSLQYINANHDLRAFAAFLKGRYFEHLQDYSTARSLYQEATRFSVPGSRFPNFEKAYEGLHRVAIYSGDIEEATYIFSELNRIRDSLLMNRTQIGFELHESEKLLETQNAQLESQQQELEAQNLYRQRLIVALIGISLLFIILFLVYRNKEMKRARERTEATNLKLSEYTKELEELAFVVSHNLRESARNISTYTGLFSREVGEDLSPKAKVYLNFMYQASLRTSEMLGDLETYVGIGSHLPEGKAINLNQIWEKVLNVKKSEVAPLEIIVNKDTLPFIKGHSATLELLFTELLDNSVKYRRGEALRVAISYTQDGNCHQIRFSDDGIGFSESYKEKVFRVFQRLHSNEIIPGTGIGLPIIDKIIRLYGGKVEAESEEGKGTTIILKLPSAALIN